MRGCGNDVMRIWLYRLVFVIASFSRVACGLLSVYPDWKQEVQMANYLLLVGFVMFCLAQLVHVMLFYVTLCYVW